MPIYEYRCRSCGHQKEYLQKVSDPPKTECPQCHQPTLSKMVTAAGFQLKGTGWYVTDFRDKAKPASKPAESGETKASEPAKASEPSGKTESASTTTTPNKDSGGSTASA
jgi:putative FmdB family regulatory protein